MTICPVLTLPSASLFIIRVWQFAEYKTYWLELVLTSKVMRSPSLSIVLVPTYQKSLFLPPALATFVPGTGFQVMSETAEALRATVKTPTVASVKEINFISLVCPIN